MIVSSDRVLSNRPFNDAPIGIFDSGFGGLTVAREIAKELPEESIVYFGDTARCPYGPRSQDEVDGFVQQICTWLVGRDGKLLVPPRGYDLSIPGFVAFLRSGLEAYRNGQ